MLQLCYDDTLMCRSWLQRTRAALSGQLSPVERLEREAGIALARALNDKGLGNGAARSSGGLTDEAAAYISSYQQILCPLQVGGGRTCVVMGHQALFSLFLSSVDLLP